MITFVLLISKEKLFFLAVVLKIQPEVPKIKLYSFILIDYLQTWLAAFHYSAYHSPGNPMAMGPLRTDPWLCREHRRIFFCSPAAIYSCCLYCRTQTSVFIISHKSRSASYEGATFLPSSGSSCTLFLKLRTRPLVPEVKKYMSPKNSELSLHSRCPLPTTLR